MSKNVFVKYGVGADMSKDSFHGCFSGMTETGAVKIIAQKKFSNNKTGHTAFKNWIEKNRKDENLPYQILLEVTGVYHESLLYFLFDNSLSVCLELAKRVKKYLEVIGHKSKNDKLDGKGIATMACERKLKPWKPASQHIRKLRTLLRHRKALMQTKNRLDNQLHAIKHSALVEKGVRDSLVKLIKVLKKEIDKIEKQTIELAKEEEAFFKKVNLIVESVKGLGLLSVLTAVAETNGFEEFYSAKQLTSYAGYDVVEFSSGKYAGKTKISKKGNAHLRTNMYMPTLALIRSKIPPFYNLYLRLLVRNGGIKKKALVAVQRKLLVLIYTLWKKNEAFDLKYYQNIGQAIEA